MFRALIQPDLKNGTNAPRHSGLFAVLCLVGVFAVAYLDAVDVHGIGALYPLFPLLVALRYRSKVFYPVLVAASAGPLMSLGWEASLRRVALWEWISAGASGIAMLLVVFGIVRVLNLIRKEARTDQLTQAYNRRGLDELGALALRRCAERSLPMSLLTADIDDFKKLNDAHGHAAGDDVLRIVGGVLRETHIGVSIPVRMGGDEFVLLLPEVGEAEAEEIGRAFQADVVRRLRSAGHFVGVSAAWATFDPVPGSLDELLEVGDQRLYAQKRVRKSVRIAG